MKPVVPRILAALAALACIGAAHASGGGPFDPYVNRSAPDIALSRYETGDLGVVMSSYNRLYLYAAWRSVILGADGIKKAPVEEAGLLRAIGNRHGGWMDASEGAGGYKDWEQAVSTALKKPVMAARQGNSLVYGYINCPLTSYSFAITTLNGLAKRADATPERLAAWVSSQRQVFRTCGDDPDSTRSPYEKPKPVIPPPVELPASEALYWRQMQQYQLASAAFYSEDYARASKLFAAIGATDKHPLRGWGEYLSLRAQARAAVYLQEDQRWNEAQAIRNESPEAAAARLTIQQKKLAGIQDSVTHILANPELASLHEASRAIGRSMQVHLTPALRFAELSKLLDDPRANPYKDDHLGDWRVLADDLLQSPSRDKLRGSASFVDWIVTIQQNQAAHALAEWQRHVKEGNKPQARAWLLASALLSTRLTPEQEQAALQVPASAPEYLTLRHALARHYRLAGQADKARALTDAVLASPVLTGAQSNSARNQFLQERFAVATSPADAAKYLLRTQAIDLDPDTGELAKSRQPSVDIGADGQRWLNSGLSAADLLTVAAQPSLPAQWRARIATAAWMRFDLLRQHEAALSASRQVEQIAPALAGLTTEYRKLPGAPERHHALLLGALNYGMSPMFQGYAMADKPRDRENTLADMWCKMPAKAGEGYMENTDAEESLPLPSLGDTATRDKELAQLGTLKTATGYIGDAVLARAKAQPNDPALPWLLYVTVQSTRGGCLDADVKTLSKSAFSLLHKRYGNTEWATKTPYYY
ncbi:MULTISPECIES: hypothetical protein [unclassified Duganella]|uniref:hypothetical protein n=1 Tax=unclassified Duganella TaxID=2636909 RepID=UPI0008879B4F|nr:MULTISPECIES: hypothetical protein [unclassified Duganella]SDG78915.1 hypothetical protein SAMN05216320_10775 [Duganella sp. OV458]SDK05952.1 hypothetical protein SAMN05428973_10875 [Duganella sp. OV510]